MEQQTGTEPVEIFTAEDFDEVDKTESTESTTEQKVENSPAVEETTEPASQESTEPVEADTSTQKTEESQTETNLVDDFLAKKGISKNDPDAIDKVVKMYRDAEKELGKSFQEKAHLEREIAKSSLPETDPNRQALAEVRQLRTERAVEQWKAAKNLTPENEAKMMAWVSQPIVDPQTGQPIVNPQTGQPMVKGLYVVNGAITLDEAYKLAGCEDETAQRANELKQNLKNEVVKEMTARQTAKRPTANATNSTEFDKPEQDDPFMAGLMEGI